MRGVLTKLAASSLCLAAGAAAALVPYAPELYNTSLSHQFNVAGCTADQHAAKLRYTVYPHIPAWNKKTAGLSDTQKRDFSASFYRQAETIIRNETHWPILVGHFPAWAFNTADPSLVGLTRVQLDPLREKIESATAIPVLLGIGAAEPATPGCIPQTPSR